MAKILNRSSYSFGFMSFKQIPKWSFLFKLCIWSHEPYANMQIGKSKKELKKIQSSISFGDNTSDDKGLSMISKFSEIRESHDRGGKIEYQYKKSIRINLRDARNSSEEEGILFFTCQNLHPKSWRLFSIQ